MFALLSNYVAYLFCLRVWAQVAFNISKSNMSSTVCNTRRVEWTVSYRIHKDRRTKMSYIDVSPAAYSI